MGKLKLAPVEFGFELLIGILAASGHLGPDAAGYSISGSL